VKKAIEEMFSRKNPLSLPPNRPGIENERSEEQPDNSNNDNDKTIDGVIEEISDYFDELGKQLEILEIEKEFNKIAEQLKDLNLDLGEPELVPAGVSSYSQSHYSQPQESNFGFGFTEALKEWGLMNGLEGSNNNYGGGSGFIPPPDNNSMGKMGPPSASGSMGSPATQEPKTSEGVETPQEAQQVQKHWYDPVVDAAGFVWDIITGGANIIYDTMKEIVSFGRAITDTYNDKEIKAGRGEDGLLDAFKKGLATIGLINMPSVDDKLPSVDDNIESTSFSQQADKKQPSKNIVNIGGNGNSDSDIWDVWDEIDSQINALLGAEQQYTPISTNEYILPPVTGPPGEEGAYAELLPHLDGPVCTENGNEIIPLGSKKDYGFLGLGKVLEWFGLYTPTEHRMYLIKDSSGNAYRIDASFKFGKEGNISDFKFVKYALKDSSVEVTHSYKGIKASLPYEIDHIDLKSKVSFDEYGNWIKTATVYYTKPEESSIWLPTSVKVTTPDGWNKMKFGYTFDEKTGRLQAVYQRSTTGIEAINT